MNEEALLRSVCWGCRWRDRRSVRLHGQPEQVSYACEIPTHRHQFGRVRRRDECVDFFPRPVLMEDR